MTLSLFVCKKKRLKLDLKEADVYCDKDLLYELKQQRRNKDDFFNDNAHFMDISLRESTCSAEIEQYSRSKLSRCHAGIEHPLL